MNVELAPDKNLENWESDLDWIDTADQLFKVRRNMKRLREQSIFLSNKLQKLSNHQTTKKGRYEYRRSERKGNVDYSKVPQLQGVDLEPFRKRPITSWRLEVVE